MATNVLSPTTSGGDSSSRSPGPWTQVVKGMESEHVSDWPMPKPSVPATTPDSDSAADVNAAVKQAWGKSSNDQNHDSVDATPVMDVASWPALPSQKSDPLKPLNDRPLSPLQESGVAFLSSYKHVIPTTPSLNSTPNHVTNTPQRSMKRGSTNGPSPPQPQSVALEISAGKLGNNSGESSHKEGGQKGGFGNDNQPQRSNSFNRRGGGGQYPRGDGSSRHGYGGRRDQDRGGQEFNNLHRSFSNRDTYMQPQRGAPRGYPRAPHASPPPPPPPFISPQPPLPLRPYAGHMVYPTEGTPPFVVVPGPPESVRAMPIMYYPIMDHQLHMKIVNQIDYYFSNENLVKDTFLRQNMDEQGWVPIKLIAGFKKVSNLTDDIQLILHAVYSSTVVEVQNDKIRKRNEWMKWIMPPGSYSPVSSPQARVTGHDMLVGQFQGVTLGGHSKMFTRSSSGEYNGQLQQAGNEGVVQPAFEHKTSAGSPSK